MPTIDLTEYRLVFEGPGGPFRFRLLPAPDEPPPPPPPDPDPPPAGTTVAMPYAAWQEEINEVDTSITLSAQIVDAYTDEEYRVDAIPGGYLISGGHNDAINKGAQTLLYQLGYRFYGPSVDHEHFIFRPSAPLATNIEVAKTRHWMDALSIFPAYGHSWNISSAGVDDRQNMNDAYNRWRNLNQCGSDAFPTGHKWSGIVGANAWYFDQDATHKAYLQPQTGSTRHLKIANVTNPTHLEEIKTIFAAEMLKNSGSDVWNAWGRKNFDGGDGDPNPSEDFYTFANAVIAKIKAGTPEIRDASNVVKHVARAGRPDAKVGVYSYASHRLPPSFSIPDIYVGIALAFNDAGIGYPELIRRNGEKAWKVGTREYIDVQVWDMAKPMQGGRKSPNYLNIYNTYRNQYNCFYSTGESQPNHLMIMPIHYAWIMKFRTGEADLEAIIDEMVTKIFSDDDAVRELYAHWFLDNNNFNQFTLYRSYEIIETMQANWYKEYFKKYILILQWHRSYPANDSVLTDPDTGVRSYNPSSTYLAHLERLFEFLYRYRREDFIHSYGFLRQVANSAPPQIISMGRKNRTDPVTGEVYTTDPDWIREPPDVTTEVYNARAYDEDEYQDVMTGLETEAYQDEEVDYSDTDLVIANTGVTQDSATIGRAFRQMDTSNTYAVRGPANVVVAREGQAQQTLVFGTGLHFFEVFGSAYVWLQTDPASSNARLYMSIFFRKRLEPDSAINTTITGAVGGRPRFMWFQTDPGGAGYGLSSESRIRVIHSGGTTDVSNDPTVSNLIQPGMNRIDNNNTRGFHKPQNVTPWLSGDASKALMTRAMAVKEGLTLWFDPEA